MRKDKPSRREKFAQRKALGLHKTSSTKGWDKKIRRDFFYLFKACLGARKMEKIGGAIIVLLLKIEKQEDSSPSSPLHSMTPNKPLMLVIEIDIDYMFIFTPFVRKSMQFYNNVLLEYVNLTG